VRGKVVRIAWVFVANMAALYFAIYGSSEVRHLRSLLVTEHALGPTWQDYLRGVIPAAGIVLEILSLRIAKYVNIGYFLVLTLFWGVVCVYSWQDMHVRFYAGAFSFLALIVVLADFYLYRNTPIPKGALSTS